MDKVVIYTLAYNAESTLRRAVDSVLAQTHTNFVYYLWENGSNDRTREIIREYASKDSRIKPMYTDVNVPRYFSPERRAVVFGEQEYDYFVTLDADDEYQPDFLERAITFAKHNLCDMVCCGSDFIDSKTGECKGKRALPTDITIDSASYGALFPYYHQFLRTVWGKVFHKSIIDKIDFEKYDSIGLNNGADTLFVFLGMMHIERFGILSGTNHKYYMFPQSVYHVWAPKRIESNKVLFDVACLFLEHRCKSISPRNLEFLLIVYLNGLKDTLIVLLNSRISQTQVISGLKEMFLCSHTTRLAAIEHFGAMIGQEDDSLTQRREVFDCVVQWLINLEDVPDLEVEDYCDLGEFVSAVAENSDAWIMFKKIRIQFFLEQNRDEEAKTKLKELEEIFLS